jgi:AcrR family transcriptional regulator
MALKSVKARPLIIALDRARTVPTSEDPRRLRTRTAILEAALQLFAERTYDTISVDDITQGAAVAKGSFYNHFTDKHHLATEIGSLLHSHVAGLVAREISNFDDPAVHCVRGSMTVLRFALEHPASAQALLRLSKALFSVKDPLNSQVVEIITAGMKDGSFSEIGLEDGFMVVAGISQMMVEQAFENAWTEDVAVIAQRCCMSMLRGLGVKLPKARRLSENAAEDLLKGI